MAKAKVFLVFDDLGFLLRTRVVTNNESRWRGIYAAKSHPEFNDLLSGEYFDSGNLSCFFDETKALTPEHQAEDYDLEQGYTSVLVATIDI